ncbi:MAG: type II toxin-antitoxin system mRNA interferase toxin, RelE/StbE family [Candidatus Nealsonbacteria bacterium]
MFEILVTEEFKKRYRKLPFHIQKKAEKKEEVFYKNPFNPLLHIEKFEPKRKEVWSFRIDKEYRILFKFVNSNKVIFMTCGHHNWVYRYKF